MFDITSNIVVPGADSAFTAMLIEREGFDAVYMSGSGTASTIHGLPDVGLLTLTEMTDNARRIVNAVDVPVFADADTGFGNVVNARRTVQEYERAGVTAIQLEDQVFPKKCGHMDGKQVVSREESVRKIEAACAARTRAETLVIARTDALAVLGETEAIERCYDYVNAGADILFPEALASREHYARVGQELGQFPLIANMTEWGKSPMLPADDLFNLGFNIVLFPSAAMRSAQGAVVRALREIRSLGTQADLLPTMLPRDELYELVGLKDVSNWEERFSVPDGA